MSLNKTFQLPSKNPYWLLLHNGSLERRWSSELTAPNNMYLGFGRMAVGHFRSACEITLRRGGDWGEKEEEREESPLQLCRSLQPRRLGISITP